MSILAGAKRHRIEPWCANPSAICVRMISGRTRCYLTVGQRHILRRFSPIGSTNLGPRLLASEHAVLIAAPTANDVGFSWPATMGGVVTRPVYMVATGICRGCGCQCRPPMADCWGAEAWILTEKCSTGVAVIQDNGGVACLHDMKTVEECVGEVGLRRFWGFT